jgi:hypothetical protein
MIRNQNFMWVALAAIFPIIFLLIVTFVFHAPVHRTPVAELTAADLKKRSNDRLKQVVNERKLDDAEFELRRLTLRGSANNSSTYLYPRLGDLSVPATHRIVQCAARDFRST